MSLLPHDAAFRLLPGFYLFKQKGGVIMKQLRVIGVFSALGGVM